MTRADELLRDLMEGEQAIAQLSATKVKPVREEARAEVETLLAEVAETDEAIHNKLVELFELVQTRDQTIALGKTLGKKVGLDFHTVPTHGQPTINPRDYVLTTVGEFWNRADAKGSPPTYGEMRHQPKELKHAE